MAQPTAYSPSIEDREATWRKQQIATDLRRSTSSSGTLSGYHTHTGAEYHVGGATGTPGAGLRCACSTSSSAPWTTQVRDCQ